LGLPAGAAAREAVVHDMGAGVTDLEVGPDGDLYVATADAIWRLDSPGSPQPTPSASSAPAVPTPDDGGTGRVVAIVAAAVLLAVGLLVRFAAGRRLRRAPP